MDRIESKINSDQKAKNQAKDTTEREFPELAKIHCSDYFALFPAKVSANTGKWNRMWTMRLPPTSLNKVSKTKKAGKATAPVMEPEMSEPEEYERSPKKVKTAQNETNVKIEQDQMSNHYTMLEQDPSQTQNRS